MILINTGGGIHEERSLNLVVHSLSVTLQILSFWT